MNVKTTNKYKTKVFKIKKKQKKTYKNFSFFLFYWKRKHPKTFKKIGVITIRKKKDWQVFKKKQKKNESKKEWKCLR